jgi:hypothetical protein
MSHRLIINRAEKGRFPENKNVVKSGGGLILPDRDYLPCGKFPFNVNNFPLPRPARRTGRHHHKSALKRHAVRKAGRQPRPHAVRQKKKNPP